jgi:hypothetical protein
MFIFLNNCPLGLFFIEIANYLKLLIYDESSSPSADDPPSMSSRDKLPDGCRSFDPGAKILILTTNPASAIRKGSFF